MKKLQIAALTIGATLFLTACGGPKIDASSEEAFNQSAQKIVETITDKKEKREFLKALSFYSSGEGNFDADDDDKNFLDNIKAVDGLDASDIISNYNKDKEKAKEIRDIKDDYNKAEIEADKLSKNFEFDKAEAKVKDFAKHKFLNKKVEKYVADLATKKADHELALKYVSKVEISDFKAKKEEGFTGTMYPAVYFKLKNLGDKSLDKVTVRVHYLDDNGKELLFDDFEIVDATKKYGDATSPLKPGYVQTPKNNSYERGSAISDDWKETNVKYEVVNVEFSKTTEPTLSADEKAYLPNIEVTNFFTARKKIFSKEKIVTQFGIKNNGDKALDKVALTVYFLDAEDKPIYEETYALVNSDGIVSFGETLKPGQTKELKGNHFYELDKDLPEWKDGNAKFEITEIKFDK